MKKILLSLVIVSLVLSTSVFASGSKEESEVANKSSFSVGVVTDTGGVDDRSFNQGTWEGASKYANEVGGDAKYLQSTADADYVPNLSTFADEGKTLIVAPGFLFDKAIEEVASNYEDQNFLIIDTVVSGLDNVASATFAANEGGFLAGVVAAMQTVEQGGTKVGLVLGMDFPTMQLFEAGYEAGIHAVDPSLELLTEIPNSFMDTQKGQTLASKLYDQGVKVIFAVAGATGNGCIKEAKDRRSNGQNVWIIGVDRDQYEEGIYNDTDSCILTSDLKRVDTAAYDVAKLADEGNFPGGQTLVFDLAKDGVGLPAQNPNMSAEMVSAVADYTAKIVSGSIVVPEIPSRVK
jgi:basic membrane protein A